MLDEGMTLDRVQKPMLIGPEAEVMSSDWMPQYYQGTRLGRTFHLENQAQTMAATHNTPIAAATATPIVGIFNPPSSKVNAVILSGWFANISGTPAAQAHPVWNAAWSVAALTAVPSGTIRPGIIGAATPSAMRAYNNVALTGIGTTAINLGAFRPFGMDTFAGAIAANGNNSSYDDVRGALIAPPGTIIMLLAGTGAGTSWVVSAAMSWMEVPI